MQDERLPLGLGQPEQGRVDLAPHVGAGEFRVLGGEAGRAEPVGRFGGRGLRGAGVPPPLPPDVEGVRLPPEQPVRDPVGQPETVRYTNPPSGVRLHPNDLITNEVTAIWGTQNAQEDQPILLGPIPDEWKPVIELQREVFQAGLEFMKPGTAFADMIDFVNGFMAS